jgi:transposase-like protein
MDTIIRTAFHNGRPVKDIAEFLGRQPSFVRRRIRELGLFRPRGTAKRKVTPEVIEACIAAYGAGASTADLAAKYGVDPSTIVANMKSAGFSPEPYAARRRRVLLDVDALVCAYRNGQGMQRIASTFGTSLAIVRARLIAAGVPLRQKNQRITVPYDDIIARYSAGATIAQISASTGISDWCVNRCLWDHGVVTRKPDHPDRVDVARRLMADRVNRHGCVRVGRLEPVLLALLQEEFEEVVPQYRIESGGHHFDAFAGGILWELDEQRHQRPSQRNLDVRYDQRAAQLGFEVRRIWEWDLTEFGLAKWHNHQG